MKKLLLLSATVLLTTISCGEDRDDDNNPQQEAISQKIVGTWKITKKETNGVTIPSPQSCPNHGNFEFKAEKKLFENYNSTVNNNCTTDTDLYNYVIDENAKKITVTNGYGDKMIYSVLNISSNDMILVYSEGNETIKYTFNK